MLPGESIALWGKSLLRNGKKRQREGIFNVKSLGGTGGGVSSGLCPGSFAGEGGSDLLEGGCKSDDCPAENERRRRVPWLLFEGTLMIGRGEVEERLAKGIASVDLQRFTKR